MNGSYTNGYSSNGPAGRHGGYGGNEQVYSLRSGGGTRERRPGGYGGLSPPDPHRQRGSPNQSRSPSEGTFPPRARNGTGRKFHETRTHNEPERPAEKQIKDVLEYINSSWTFMAEDECVPVQVALQLLDDSSLGLARRYDEFHQAQQDLQKALRAIVNEHHQGFNSSIGTFHQIQASIQQSHERVRTLRQSLVEAKVNLTTAKPEYKSLAASSQTYASMLDVLTTIEQIQQIPEKLETSISEKRFLLSVETLQDGLRLIRRSELENVVALNEMRVYLSNQEHSLIDILTEELHNHLYLKSPYCEDRWFNYAKMHAANGNSISLPDAVPRQMYIFLHQLDTSVPMIDEASRNPEADSFHYIHIIIESLHKLGRLDEAVKSIEQRLPVELYKVVEKTNNEIAQRHPGSTRSNWRSQKGTLEAVSDNASSFVILNDLLHTLYAKFEAIAENHRVFHDIVAGVLKRENGYGNVNLTSNFKELWDLLQSEIRSLLHDYLSEDGSTAQRIAQDASESNVFRYQRDKSKKCTFKMDWVDTSDEDLKLERDEIVATWQKFVPGLISLSQNNSGSLGNTNNSNHDSSAGHRLLVEPSVFNISCLLPASVFFVTRLKELVPPGTEIVVSTLSSFLNDFLINVFRPQLEETLSHFCSQVLTQLDTFQQDSQWDHYAKKPIFKGTVKFYDIIVAFCKMLDNLTHDQLFTHVVITQINVYYDRCIAWYKAIVTRTQESRDGRRLKAAAFFAETSQIGDLETELWTADPGYSTQILELESARLLAACFANPLDDSDLMSDRKARGSLCLLYTSMKWLALKLSQLRRVSDRAQNAAGWRDSSETQVLKRSLTGALGNDNQFNALEETYLPLSAETATLFDGLVESFQDLSLLVLRTLRLDFRCQIISTLSNTLKGAYVFEEAVEVADDRLLKLVGDLVEFDHEATKYIQQHEFAFITKGAGRLLDNLVVSILTHNITAVNVHGSALLLLNAGIVYHNLLNFESDGELTRSFAFFDLLQAGPEDIVEAATNDKRIFSTEEFKAMLKLSFSARLLSKDKEAVENARSELQEGLQRIA